MLFRSQKSLSKDNVSLKAKFTRRDNKILSLQEEKELERKIEELKLQISKVELEEKRVLQEIAGEEKLLSDITKKIENITNLGRESNCPTCTRPLLDEYDSVILSLEQIVIDTKKEKITTANKSLELIKKDKEQKAQLYKDVVKEHIELAKSVNLIDSKKKDLLLQKEHFEMFSKVFADS